MSELMSAREAAKMAGCSTSTMRRWLCGGRISGAEKAQHGWVITHDQLKQFLVVQSPTVGKQRSQALNQSPDQRLIDRLEFDLKIERERADKLESSLREIKSENRSLQEEIKALLKK